MIKVSELRIIKGLTQKQLADLLGLDQTTVSNWERGKVMPDSVNQVKLADFFNVSLDYLFGRDQPVYSSASDAYLITYAKNNGVTVEDLMAFIDLINKIKQNTSAGIAQSFEQDTVNE